MNDWEKGFTCGVAWACAVVAEEGGTIPADRLWRESNMDEKDLAVVDPNDAKTVVQY